MKNPKTIDEYIEAAEIVGKSREASESHLQTQVVNNELDQLKQTISEMNRKIRDLGRTPTLLCNYCGRRNHTEENCRQKSLLVQRYDIPMTILLRRPRIQRNEWSHGSRKEKEA